MVNLIGTIALLERVNGKSQRKNNIRMDILY